MAQTKVKPKPLDKFEEIEKEIFAEYYESDLYFKGFRKASAPKTVRSMILRIFDVQISYPTHNFKTRDLVCEKGSKNRSTKEVFLLVKHYVPKATFKQVVKTLGKLALNHEMDCLLCWNIRRRVWYKDVGFARSDLNMPYGEASGWDHELTQSDYLD